MSLTRPDLLYFPNFFTFLAEGLIGTASVAPYWANLQRHHSLLYWRYTSYSCGLQVQPHLPRTEKIQLFNHLCRMFWQATIRNMLQLAHNYCQHGHWSCTSTTPIA